MGCVTFVIFFIVKGGTKRNANEKILVINSFVCISIIVFFSSLMSGNVCLNFSGILSEVLSVATLMACRNLELHIPINILIVLYLSRIHDKFKLL